MVWTLDKFLCSVFKCSGNLYPSEEYFIRIPDNFCFGPKVLNTEQSFYVQFSDGLANYPSKEYSGHLNNEYRTMIFKTILPLKFRFKTHSLLSIIAQGKSKCGYLRGLASYGKERWTDELGYLLSQDDELVGVGVYTGLNHCASRHERGL